MARVRPAGGLSEHRIARRRGARGGAVAAGRRLLVAGPRPELAAAAAGPASTTRTAASSRTTRDGNYAWSAAFISYVMRMAGAGHRFPYSPTHADYINAARRHGLGEAPGLAITAERMESYAPQARRPDLLLARPPGDHLRRSAGRPFRRPLRHRRRHPARAARRDRRQCRQCGRDEARSRPPPMAISPGRTASSSTPTTTGSS